MAGRLKTDTRHSVLSTMVILLVLTVPLAAQSPEVFSLTTSDGPVGTQWNSSVTLPCELSPLLNVEPFEVRWYRPDNANTPAFLYKDHKIQKESMDLQYWDRVSLTGGLEAGNVSLRLENVTLEDRGEYVCQVTSKQWYDKASVFLTINVKGDEPVLSVAVGRGGQVNITCSSQGWSPEPKLTWRIKQGREITNGVEVHQNTDPQGLVSVNSWLLYSPSDTDWLSCTVSLSEEKLEGRILPSAPTQGNWRSAFITILVIDVLVVFLVIGLFLWNKKTEFVTFKKIPKTNDETELKGSPTEKTGLFKEDTCQDTDGALTKQKLCQVKLTLDLTTAHPALLTYEKTVSFDALKVRNNSIPLHVLSKESFSSGQNYWEVSVERKTSWYAGVATDKAETKAIVPLIPENGFWILSFEKSKGFHIPTSPDVLVSGRKPLQTLGLFLDCDEHSLSFYDVESKMLLHGFTDIGSNTFFCVFSPGSAETVPCFLIDPK